MLSIYLWGVPWLFWLLPYQVDMVRIERYRQTVERAARVLGLPVMPRKLPR